MEKSVNLYISKPFTSINKVIVGIWMLLGLFLTASTGLAQDGSDVTFEADTVIIKQDNSMMVARGNVRVNHEDELFSIELDWHLALDCMACNLRECSPKISGV